MGGVDRSTDGNSRSSAHIQHHPVNGVRAELMISIALESLCVQAYRRNNIISNHKSRIPFCFLFFHGSLLLRLIIFNGDRIGSIAWRNSFFYISKNLGHLNKKETEKWIRNCNGRKWRIKRQENKRKKRNEKNNQRGRLFYRLKRISFSLCTRVFCWLRWGFHDHKEATEGKIKKKKKLKTRSGWLQQWVARRVLSSYASEIRHCARPSSQIIAGFQSLFFCFVFCPCLFSSFLTRDCLFSLLSPLLSRFVFNLLLFIVLSETSLKIRAQNETQFCVCVWVCDVQRWGDLCSTRPGFYMPKYLCSLYTIRWIANGLDCANV